MSGDCGCACIDVVALYNTPAGPQSLAATLAVGNTTNGLNVVLSAGSQVTTPDNPAGSSDSTFITSGAASGLTGDVVLMSGYSSTGENGGVILRGQGTPSRSGAYISALGANDVLGLNGDAVILAGGASGFGDAGANVIINAGDTIDTLGGSIIQTIGGFPGLPAVSGNYDVLLRSSGNRALRLNESSDASIAPVGAVATLDANKVLTWSPLTAMYTVGRAGIAKYQTIQSAINAAEAAGASGAANAVILILGGQYTENLVMNSGGVLLVGWGYDSVYILGTITYNWPTQTIGFYSLSNVRVSGLITHQGAGVGTKRFTSHEIRAQAGITATTDVSWTDFLSTIQCSTAVGLPVIRGTAWSSHAFYLTNVFLNGGTALTGLAYQATTASSLIISGGLWYGRSEYTSPGGRIQNCVYETSGNNSPVTANFGATACMISGTSFQTQSGSTAPVIVKNGAGVLYQAGNNWVGPGVPPAVLIQVNAGTVVTGVPVV